jgi:hypothetical protein
MFTLNTGLNPASFLPRKSCAAVIAGLALAMSVPEFSAANASETYGGPGCESTWTDDFGRYIKPGWQEIADYPDNQQKLIIASDPQAFRYMDNRSNFNEEIDRGEWNKRTEVYDAIREERRVNYYVPVLVNGDMTEYGHRGEREATRSMLRRMAGNVGGPLIFPGLGNHDYSNNVDDCANNGCARDATCDHIAWVNKIEPKNSFDYEFSGSTHQGSLSYSVDVGRVHIIQLNNDPTYTRTWETGGGMSFRQKRRFEITSSIQWLEKDLAQAHARGQQIIINVHKPHTWDDGYWQRHSFQALVKKYQVAAVFAGHHHERTGLENYGSGPIFQSGALAWGSYLRVFFDWTHMKLRVEAVTMDGSNNSRYELDLPIK